MPTHKQSTRSAGVYARGANLFFAPYFTATTGISVIGDPVNGLAASAPDAELGQALFETLEKSKAGVDPPSDQGAEALSRVCKAAGVKSWSTFMKGTRYCDVRQKEGRLLFTPTQREAGGFLGTKGMDLELELPKPAAEVGAALRVALSRSE